jgi:hypothetical protein
MGKFWRFCFGVYGFALQNPKQFAGFLERFVGDWLPPLEQALGAAGFPPERAGSLATLSLAAMRGLQLDCSLPASEPASKRHSGRCWDC